MSQAFRFHSHAARMTPLAIALLLLFVFRLPAFAQSPPAIPAATSPEQMQQYANDLTNAIYSRDEAKVESIVNLHPELVTRIPTSNQSPLQAAVNVSNADAVKFLLSKGADSNISAWYGENPIQQSLNDAGRIEIFQMLFEKIGDVKVLQPDGTTLIQQAVRHRNRTAVAFLMQRGAKVDQVGVSGDTPMHEAVRSGDKSMVQFLADSGAKLDLRNYRGDLPIHLAMRAGYTSGNSGPMGSGYYAPNYVMQKVYSDITLLLLDLHSPDTMRDQFGMTPFSYALLNDDRAEYSALETTPKDRVVAVFDAAARNDAAALVRLLAANPMYATQRLTDGATPIHVAALWGARDTVALLLKRGADINARDGGGSTPLHYASRARNGASMISFLLAHGAYLGARNARDETALHVAVLSQSVENAKILIAKKADVHARGEFSGAPLSDVDTRDGLAMANLLLSAGANVRESTQNNDDSLFVRAVNNDNIALATLLAKHGADINATGRNSYTPLMTAVMRRDVPLVQALLTLGVDRDVSTSDGETALTIATRNDNKEMIALLQPKAKP